MPRAVRLASFLAFEQAAERLAEAHQFEALQALQHVICDTQETTPADGRVIVSVGRAAFRYK